MEVICDDIQKFDTLSLTTLLHEALEIPPTMIYPTGVIQLVLRVGGIVVGDGEYLKDIVEIVIRAVLVPAGASPDRGDLRFCELDQLGLREGMSAIVEIHDGHILLL